MSFGFFESLVYPGRLIILGRDPTGKYAITIYAVTGRSPSSQARKMEFREDGMWVKPTEKEIIKTGNLDLLIYPSLFVLEQGVAVSNGKQTVDVMACLGHSLNASEVLSFSLKKWEYEPDAPSFTPRISGCVLNSGGAALNIIKRAENDASMRHTFEFPLIPGRGKYIATYTGENRDPLPSFQGEPEDVVLEEKNPESMAEAVYAGLGPKPQAKDFRVSVACVYSEFDKPEKYHVALINRSERKEQ